MKLWTVPKAVVEAAAIRRDMEQHPWERGGGALPEPPPMSQVTQALERVRAIWAEAPEKQARLQAALEACWRH